MLLKKLELVGFKSFARKTDFSFTSPITAIVGPNGSGKSNIAEAVQFVLGEQSMKSLRTKRGEDLIFHGSPNIPRLSRASVTLMFDNRKRLLPIDYDEVSVERVVHRDATSQYLLNGSAVRLKDIVELLSSIHIGASAHHIISQGRTDHILAASIEERRGMIEDALGLKIYQYKRAESERKLAKTKENSAHVEALRKEIAPHLSFLEKQMAKIRKAEELRSELEERFREYLAIENAYISRRRKELADESKAPRDERARIERDMSMVEDTLDQGEPTEDTSAAEQYEEKLLRMRNKKDELARFIGRLEGMLEYASRRKESDGDGTEDIILPRNTFTEFTSRLVSIADEALRGKSGEQWKQAFRDIKEEVRRFWDIHVTTRKRIGVIPDEEYKKVRAQKEDIEKEYAALEKEEEKLTAEYNKARAKAAEHQREARTRERDLFSLRSRYNELTTRLEILALEEKRLTEEETAFKQACTEAGLLLGRGVLNFNKNGTGGAPGEPRDAQEKRRWKIERLKMKIEEVGSGGDEVVKEYEEVKRRDEHFARELADLQKSAESLEKLIRELGEKIDAEFKAGVESINKEFQRLFSLMFGGGSAGLKIVAPPPRRRRKDTDLLSDAPEEEEYSDVPDEEERQEGIDIAVNLPSKKIKGLEMLSGGERSLTSIALIFAITRVNPPPFLLLDETDAALDEANSRKFGDLVTELSKDTQFIIITHNRETMTRAGVLYGVTAGADGISRVLSVKLDDAVSLVE